MDLRATLHAIFVRSPPNLFDAFLEECQRWYEQPAHSLQEMRVRNNKKIRGDLFEWFSVLYLKHVKGYRHVWRLEDVPDVILGGLSLKRPDMGIDIICERDGKYTAVQCKYKKHRTMTKNIVTWNQLSTFYALCLRTGPWESYVVMTNCEYVRHMGKKTKKDISICLRTLRGITKEEWVAMCGLQGVRLTPPVLAEKPKTQEDLRAARLAFYDRKNLVEKSNADSEALAQGRSSCSSQDREEIFGGTSLAVGVSDGGREASPAPVDQLNRNDK
jgi:hypothetical protein